jgi:TonB-linked SusC/RagA family outer membrane protein
MKKILQMLFVCGCAISTISLYAQERVVGGKVTTIEDAAPLPGVNVVVKGTTNGAFTDANGEFKISLNGENNILVFTFIGYKSQEIEIANRTTLDVQMQQDITQLNEVVVTGLNIKQDVKSLAYSAQTVSSERLNMTRANNISDAISGKVAGVQVRGQSGAALGRNSSIRIRGAGSLSDKEPLFILDGTPVSSQDINPDDIETINVLKGPSATAIYGQRGDAGVVMMTSKKGKQQPGLGITLNQNMFVDQVYILPKWQNSYAGGAESELTEFNWQSGMPEEWKSLDGKFYHDYTDDSSWGPRMVGQEYIPWYAWIPGTKYTGQTAKLVPQPDNVRDFYNTGINSVTNLSFSQAKDDLAFRFSYTKQKQTGLMPNTGLDKNTLAVNTSYKFGKSITIGANVNYVNQALNGFFDDDYSNQSSGSFNQWFHRNLDLNILKELQDVRSPGGRLVSWNHFNPDSYLQQGDKFYRGFYWWNHFAFFNKIDFLNTRDRLFGDLNATIDVGKKVKVSAFYRINQRNEHWENKVPSILPYSFYTELRPTNQDGYDYYGTGQTFRKEDNVEALATYSDRFMNDQLSIDIGAGANLRNEQYSTLQNGTLDGLVVPDLFTLSNSRRQPYTIYNNRWEKQVKSLYGRGTVGYNDLIFLTWSLRNDWSSALPENKNSYLYGSVGASFVFSELTESALPFLSYGKLRGSWAQVGSDLNPYGLKTTYSLGANAWLDGAGNSNILTNVPDVLYDPNIRPAISTSQEFGVDLKFMQNKLGLSATYFTEVKRDEILDVPITGTSGFSTKRLNAGQLERQVMELQLDASPVQTKTFQWDVTLNLAKTSSKITSLYPGINQVSALATDENLVVGTVGSQYRGSGMGQVYHIVGQQWGQIRGYGIETREGLPVVDEAGLYVRTKDPIGLGSVLPEFTGGFISAVSYKNFFANFNIDFQKGGKFFSLSDMWGTFSGLTERTASLNDQGNPVRDAVADGGGVHVTGYEKVAVKDVNGDPVTNEAGEQVYNYVAYNDYVDAQSYYWQFWNNKISTPHVYDLSFVKLRELSIGYNLPIDKLGGLGQYVRAIQLSVVGRNLWLMYSKTKDYDPSQISGTFGENGQFPGTRSYGFNLKVSF